MRTPNVSTPDESPGAIEPGDARSQQACIRAAACGVAFHTSSIASVSTLFVLGLGASAFQVGLLATLLNVAPVFQLAGARLMPRVGKVRLLALSRLMVMIPMAGLIALAWLGGRGPVPLTLALLFFAAAALVTTVGSTGWWPILQDNTQPRHMGQFFARMRTRLRFVEVALPILIGFYLGKNPPLRRFVLPFSIGLAALLLGSYVCRAIREKPLTVPPLSFALRLRLAGRSLAAKRYFLFASLYFFFILLITPFWIVMLQQQGLSDNVIMWLMALSSLGHVAGLKLWAHMVDHYGGRAVLSLCLAGQGLLGLGWLAMPTHYWPLLMWSLGFWLVWGFLDGGCMMGRTWSMMAAIPQAYQADGYSLAALIFAVVGAAGSFLGGALFEAITRSGWHLGELDGRILYLAVTQLTLLLPWWTRRKLKDFNQQTSARTLLSEAARRFLARQELE